MKDIDTFTKGSQAHPLYRHRRLPACVPWPKSCCPWAISCPARTITTPRLFAGLKKRVQKVYLGQTKANLTPDIQLVIYTNAILKGNEELEWAKAHYPCFERAELLAAMSRIFSNCIGISGTHGKTTTSSMTTQVLLEAGLDPSAVIGGKLPAINAYGRYGHSQNFVCESCEYNNTFLHISGHCGGAEH